MEQPVSDLDRFTVSGDYGRFVDLECEDCFTYVLTVGTNTPLPHLIELARKHNEEKHSEQSSR